MFKEEVSNKILKTFDLITNMEEYQEVYNYDWRKHKSRILIEKYRWNKKLYRWINKPKWIDQKVIGCVSISAFASLVGIPVVITNYAVGSKICVITARIKKHKSVIKKKKKNHDKIILIAKAKLNSIEVLISRSLIDSNITHDEFVSINNVKRI